MTIERPFQEATPRKRLWPASALEHARECPRVWLLEHRIPAGVVSMLGGDGGVGKSQIALQLAVATVTGTPFLGRPVKRGPVVFIAAEDDDEELRRRLIPICAEAGVTLSDLGDLHILTLTGEDALLAVPEEGRTNAMRGTPLLNDLAAEAREIAPVLIVIDTLADVFGGSEFDRGQVRSFLTRLRGAFCGSGAAVLLLAHPSLAGMREGRAASGSTGWTNSVRAALTLTREKTGLRTLSVTKSNYGPNGIEVHLRWREGVFALAAQGDVPTHFKTQAKRNSERAEEDTRRLSDNLPPGDVEPKQVAVMAEKLGLLRDVKTESRRSVVSRWRKRVVRLRERDTRRDK